jgi:hypothetical protein
MISRKVGRSSPGTLATRIELRMRLHLHESQGIEIGLEVAAHPVGADQLQGANRIDGGAPEVLEARGGDGSSRAFGAVAQAIGEHMAALQPPAGTAQFLLDRAGLVGKFREETTPALVDCAGIAQIARIKFGDKGGITAR